MVSFWWGDPLPRHLLRKVFKRLKLGLDLSGQLICKVFKTKDIARLLAAKYSFQIALDEDAKARGTLQAASGYTLILAAASSGLPFSPYGDATGEAKIRASIGKTNTEVLRLRLRMTVHLNFGEELKSSGLFSLLATTTGSEGTTAASDGGDDREFGGIINAGLFLFRKIADVFVVDVDVHEGA